MTDPALFAGLAVGDKIDSRFHHHLTYHFSDCGQMPDPSRYLQIDTSWAHPKDTFQTPPKDTYWTSPKDTFQTSPKSSEECYFGGKNMVFRVLVYGPGLETEMGMTSAQPFLPVSCLFTLGLQTRGWSCPQSGWVFPP